MLYPFNLSFSLSLLFMGFLFANFFGIITSTKSVIFIFIMFIELINCFVYTQSSRLRFQKLKIRQTSLFKRIFFFIKESFFSVQKFSPLSSSMPIPRSQYPKGVKGYRGDLSSAFLPLDKIESKGVLTRNYSLSYAHSFRQEKNAKVFDYVFTYTLTILNFLKIGFEFGFFVDAFKLGS